MEKYDIFVYCGGKCGSATLLNTFIKNGYSTAHTHSNFYWKASHKTDIFNTINDSCKDKKIYIIDSYRTPIERKISSLFQNIKKHLPNYNDLTIEEIISFFNSKLINTVEEYHPINEVLQYYKLPLFDKFDFEKRYNIIEKDNIVFIKILFNDINKWNEILSEIINKKIVIFPNNLTNNKNTAELYKKFKDNYKVPKDYINNVLIKDIEFKIYNTTKEQEEYIKKYLLLSY